MGSDGFDSPGSSILGKPGFNFLPYGVRTPDSIMSTGSRDWLGSAGGSSGYYGAGWKLPDKLRIIKPLEGSLTLHHWQRLAKPHLGNILEEREGVAMKGAGLTLNHARIYSRHRAASGGLGGLDDSLVLSDFDEDDLDSENPLSQTPRRFKHDTRTQHTYTDCTVLHPDENSAMTQLTSSYGGAQMSSGFGEYSQTSSRMSSRPTSRMSSRMSSRRQSISETPEWRRSGTLTFSSNIGLARVLNERHISGKLSGSTTSLHRSGFTSVDNMSVSSLTPSIISTPAGDKSFSPTGTPLNSPLHTPPGTPPNGKVEESGESGIVVGFFSSLRAALYGEQQKEVQTLRRNKKKSMMKKKFGILAKVEEVGVENLLSASPAPSSTEGESRESSVAREDALSSRLSDFDLRYVTSGDEDELEAIRPGSLTIPHQSRVPSSPANSTIGQLNPPAFSIYGRPSLSPADFGQIPPSAAQYPNHSPYLLGGPSTAVMGGRGPGRMVASPGENRPQLLGGFGVPGQPGTGALSKTAVPLTVRPDLGSVPVTSKNLSPQQQEQQGFIGSITSMFFGRKGGLL